MTLIGEIARKFEDILTKRGDFLDIVKYCAPKLAIIHVLYRGDHVDPDDKFEQSVYLYGLLC